MYSIQGIATVLHFSRLEPGVVEHGPTTVTEGFGNAAALGVMAPILHETQAFDIESLDPAYMPSLRRNI